MTQQKDGLHDTGFEQAGGPEREPRLFGGKGGDDLAGTGATSMTDGEQAQASTGQPAGNNQARPGGSAGGAASADQTPLDPSRSASPGPMGEGGGGQPSGAGANGSLGSGTYNERGNVTGPDSPAGQGAGQVPEGAGQGDDLANRLGGDAGRGTGLSGAGAATGNLGADRSEASAAGAAGAGGPSAGDPGGMGGAGASGGTGTGRPPGGVSPLGSSGE